MKEENVIVLFCVIYNVCRVLKKMLLCIYMYIILYVTLHGKRD